MTSPRSRDRAKRITAVTAALSGAGGLVGALCGSATVAILVGLHGGPRALPSRELARLFEVAAEFGAAAGIVGAPLLGWGLLRQVPLYRAIAATAAGCVVGAVIGEVVRPLGTHPMEVPAVLPGALVGFVLAGLLVRLGRRRAPDDLDRTV